jgi:endonuclease/exonuclease/phosphatase family metal-dependent hydrolase
MVPTAFRDTDQFIDIVSWNIRFFDHKDPERVEVVTDVLASLGSDVFVLLEVADDGVLDEVIEKLNERGVGRYSVVVGPNGERGGQQRVAVLWDRDWVRAKRKVSELFASSRPRVADELKGGNTVDVFPRLPVAAYFEAKAEDGTEAFSFDLVGLHLKAQGPKPRDYEGGIDRFGVPQRQKSAELLTKYLEENLGNVLMVGDWNADPDKPEWESVRSLEASGSVLFEKINPKGVPTHLARINKSGVVGSRLDLHLVTDEVSAKAVPQGLGAVVMWSAFDHLDDLTSDETKELYKAVRQTYSDHLPVVSRFYGTAAK